MECGVALTLLFVISFLGVLQCMSENLQSHVLGRYTYLEQLFFACRNAYSLGHRSERCGNVFVSSFIVFHTFLMALLEWFIVNDGLISINLQSQVRLCVTCFSC